MKKDPNIFIYHIAESIDKIKKYSNSMTEKELMGNDGMQDAIIRRFEIIGEATKNLPADFKRKHPEINWKELADTRNMFIHEYYGVDIKRIFRSVKTQIPALKEKLSKISDELNIKKLL